MFLTANHHANQADSRDECHRSHHHLSHRDIHQYSR
jgi:hypothetical protein